MGLHQMFLSQTVEGSLLCLQSSVSSSLASFDINDISIDEVLLLGTPKNHSLTPRRLRPSLKCRLLPFSEFWRQLMGSFTSHV